MVVASGAGARTDRHPVRSGQRADGRNRNENPPAREAPAPDAPHITCPQAWSPQTTGESAQSTSNCRSVLVVAAQNIAPERRANHGSVCTSGTLALGPAGATGVRPGCSIARLSTRKAGDPQTPASRPPSPRGLEWAITTPSKRCRESVPNQAWVKHGQPELALGNPRGRTDGNPRAAVIAATGGPESENGCPAGKSAAE